jgi:hypothetical protein
LEPTVQEVNDLQNDEHLPLRERIRARVEITPIGIFVITVLGNIVVFMILGALVNWTKWWFLDPTMNP